MKTLPKLIAAIGLMAIPTACAEEKKADDHAGHDHGEHAEKKAGEWQQCDITLVDWHVTVILNGQTIIDNQPVLGCTGGALWSDPFRAGPIYLQGDHTGVTYRNIVLRPVVK